MNNYNIAKALCIAVIALYLPYCAEKPNKAKTYDAGIALSAEEDMLRLSIHRRLCALEQIKYKSLPPIEAMTASEAVSQ